LLRRCERRAEQRQGGQQDRQKRVRELMHRCHRPRVARGYG
jgi:hypothetical protein